MEWYRADLHIHSVLSPCGDLDMSPVRIIQEAKNKKIDIIGITDHNSTRHAKLMVELGKREGITVFPGVELNTKEEAHCLAFFENIDKVQVFQEYIDKHLPFVKNKPEIFGMQLIVNEKEEIIDKVEGLLIVALDCSIEEAEAEAHKLGGVFIPAHIDRQANGIFNQIGFISEKLQIDALEFSLGITQGELLEQKPDLDKYSLITNSDAHIPSQIGTGITEYFLEAPTFDEWKKALKNIDGRLIRTL